jgi:hypothetical protein
MKARDRPEDNPRDVKQSAIEYSRVGGTTLPPMRNRADFAMVCYQPIFSHVGVSVEENRREGSHQKGASGRVNLIKIPARR